eukprot:2778941-Pyramimonas_sp.AAC.1
MDKWNWTLGPLQRAALCVKRAGWTVIWKPVAPPSSGRRRDYPGHPDHARDVDGAGPRTTA